MIVHHTTPPSLDFGRLRESSDVDGSDSDEEQMSSGPAEDLDLREIQDNVLYILSTHSSSQNDRGLDHLVNSAARELVDCKSAGTRHWNMRSLELYAHP